MGFAVAIENITNPMLEAFTIILEVLYFHSSNSLRFQGKQPLQTGEVFQKKAQKVKHFFDLAPYPIS